MLVNRITPNALCTFSRPTDDLCVYNPKKPTLHGIIDYVFSLIDTLPNTDKFKVTEKIGIFRLSLNTVYVTAIMHDGNHYELFSFTLPDIAGRSPDNHCSLTVMPESDLKVISDYLLENYYHSEFPHPVVEFDELASMLSNKSTPSCCDDTDVARLYSHRFALYPTGEVIHPLTVRQAEDYRDLYGQDVKTGMLKNCLLNIEQNDNYYKRIQSRLSALNIPVIHGIQFSGTVVFDLNGLVDLRFTHQLEVEGRLVPLTPDSAGVFHAFEAEAIFQWVKRAILPMVSRCENMSFTYVIRHDGGVTLTVGNEHTVPRREHLSD